MATLAEALGSLDDSKVRHIVSLSGGKDSTALAIYLKQQYPRIPAEYVFCDTGTELPETYEYLARLEAYLGKRIARLDALDVLRVRRKSGRAAFDIYLNEVFSGFLPNPRSRWCTRVLKIEPFEAYVGSDRAFGYIGIRGDESREGYKPQKPPVISDRPNILPVYPFKDDGIGIAGVRRLLEESGLGFPEYYKWRSRSGCYFCFYQQAGEWKGLAERHPELFEKAKSYERASGDKRFTWVAGRALQEVVERSQAPSTLPDPDDTDGCAICHL